MITASALRPALAADAANMLLFGPMTAKEFLSRRGFLAMAAVCAHRALAKSPKHIPVGLLIYAVLADWKKDFNGTLTAVAQMGY